MPLGIYATGGAYLHASVRIVEAHNILLSEAIADLHFDQLEWRVSGVCHAMFRARRHKGRLIPPPQKRLFSDLHHGSSTDDD